MSAHVRICPLHALATRVTAQKGGSIHSGNLIGEALVEHQQVAVGIEEGRELDHLRDLDRVAIKPDGL